MAGLNFSPEELSKCKHWFKYIFMPAAHNDFKFKSYLYNSGDSYSVAADCTKILNVILERIFDMQVGGNIDEAFKDLARVTYLVDPNGNRYDDANQYKLSADLMVRFLAYICLTKHIF